MTEPTERALAKRMRAYAAQHPDVADEFVQHAEKLESINDDTRIPTLVGIWARARKAWCRETGEDLV